MGRAHRGRCRVHRHLDAMGMAEMSEDFERITAACRTLGRMQYWTGERNLGKIDDAELGRRLRPMVDELDLVLLPHRER